ncbi:DUF1476 domain-containing protein [Amaricoccus macauensis]|uniref:DUF1476 domain-containing protein n=1 Tax=Amaricoccus macauensis TaxID=57001 RepID=UPI003C79D831
MTLFDDRERGFENKFVHDEELLFRFYARRNKLLGNWAAELLGKSGPDRDAYAREVVLSDLVEVDHESDVYRKVSEDLEALADERTIKVKMAEFLEMAKQQVMSEEK